MKWLVVNIFHKNPFFDSFFIQMILNRTLDDIEHFAATIKRACEAARELTDRKSVKKSKKSRKESKEHGMGILQLRSRLPPLEAYKECYQKFKYCLNYMVS